VRLGTATHCNERILDYLHTDVWGPTKTVWIGGNHYFVYIIDDYFRRCWVYTIKHKGEVLELFVDWKKNMEKKMERKKSGYYVQTMEEGIQTILAYNYIAMRA